MSEPVRYKARLLPGKKNPPTIVKALTDWDDRPLGKLESSADQHFAETLDGRRREFGPLTPMTEVIGWLYSERDKEGADAKG